MKLKERTINSPQVGFEPMISLLTANFSTTELLMNIGLRKPTLVLWTNIRQNENWFVTLFLT